MSTLTLNVIGAILACMAFLHVNNDLYMIKMNTASLTADSGAGAGEFRYSTLLSSDLPSGPIVRRVIQAFLSSPSDGVPFHHEMFIGETSNYFTQDLFREALARQINELTSTHVVWGKFEDDHEYQPQPWTLYRSGVQLIHRRWLHDEAVSKAKNMKK